jgi:hypothetical protein
MVGTHRAESSPPCTRPLSLPLDPCTQRIEHARDLVDIGQNRGSGALGHIPEVDYKRREAALRTRVLGDCLARVGKRYNETSRETLYSFGRTQLATTLSPKWVSGTPPQPQEHPES